MAILRGAPKMLACSAGMLLAALTLIIFLPGRSFCAVPSFVRADGLFILPTTDVPALQKFLAAFKANGGRADHVFPPNAVIGQLLPAAEAELRRQTAGLRIERGVVASDPQRGLANGAEIAVHVWNTNFHKMPAPLIGRSGGPTPREPPNDARTRPGREPSGPLRRSGAPAGAPPGASQTSEYLVGSVLVKIITPESNGAVDPSSEDWSGARQTTVVSKITEGLQWWKDNANAPVNLSFVYEIHHSVATSYEPITRDSDFANECLWVRELIVNLGGSGSACSGSNQQHFAAVENYLHSRRVALGTDWAMAIFVVDSLNDPDGYFSDLSFAYAYLNGPFMVMTYDNDNWGIGQMNLVTAHENGHIWGALDEYASSGCTTSETSGYLNIANANCENGAPTENSIMRSAGNQQIAYPNHQLSTPARQAVGWRDSDGDGKERYDPVDTTVSITLTPFSPDPTTDSTPTYSGTVQDIAFDSPTHMDVTINKIVAVEWRVDGGPWQLATASDGAFDEDSESFTFTAPVLSTATHTFEARATNTVGNLSTIASDTLTVSPNPAVNMVTLATTTGTAAEGGASGLFTVTRTGSTVAPLVVNYTVGGTATPGSDYQTLSGSVTINATSATAPIAIVPVDDLLLESSETVTVTLSLSANYNIGSPSTGTVTINDNDTPGGSFEIVDCALASLQSAIDAAPAGKTLLVTGTCNGNLLVRNEKQRLTIDGQGVAIINAASSGQPAFNVRGKGILIRGFTVNGGSDGIHVNRGANAVLQLNTIQNSVGSGVAVDQLSFAALIGNQILGHPEAGVWVGENSTARIGFNADSDSVASANTIQTNGVGIVVSNGSSARIVGNIVQNNIGDGIQVTRDAQADIASNSLLGNGGDGIEVADNGAIQLGEDSGTDIFQSPNSGATSAGFGVRCLRGGVADGRIGALSGTLGPKSLAAGSCLDSLSP